MDVSILQTLSIQSDATKPYYFDGSSSRIAAFKGEPSGEIPVNQVKMEQENTTNKVVYKKNDFRDIDDMVFEVRACVVANGDACGKTINCRCDKLKEDLLICFAPFFFKLIKYHAKFHQYCYSFREDFEQDLKAKFIEMVYNWDDTRGIYFVTYVHIMLGKWMWKLHNVETNWNKRKFENFMLRDIIQPDNNTTQIKKFFSDERVGEWMTNLTPKQKVVVEARYLNSLMVNEISNILGISPGAVSNLLKRAYKILKEVVDEENDRTYEDGSDISH